MRKHICLFLSLIFIFSKLFSQSYNFKIYSIDEGIPQSQVHSIIQDKNNFLWFGTDGGGLTFFDGKQFISYTTTEGLSNDVVYQIAEDAGGKLWVATAKGLSIFQNKKFLPLPAALKPLEKSLLRSVFIDRKGVVFFGTNNGAFIFNGKTLEEIVELKNKTVLAVYMDKEENHWFGSNEGAFVIYKNKTSKRYTTKEGLSNNTCNAFLEGKQGGLYIATENRLNILQNESLSILPLPAPENAKQNIRNLNYDKDGNMWIGTWDCGIYKMENDKTTRYGKNEGITVDGINCFLEDKEGCYWFGTDGAGAVKLGEQTFTSIRAQNGLPNEMVLSICKTRSGTWWYGHDGSVSYFDGKIYKSFDSKNGLTNEKVWRIMEDTRGSIWICTYGSGIFKYTNGKFINFNDKTGLNTNNVRAVFQDSKGRIWAGPSEGINLFDGTRFQKVTGKYGLVKYRTLGFYEDKKNNLWIATSNSGLVKLMENKEGIYFKNFTAKDGMAGDGVLSITEDNKGNIWTASFDGISMLDPVTYQIKKITKKDGLTSNTVYALAFADETHLLIGTNSGLDKLDISEYKKDGKVILKHFGKQEGFSGVECNTNSVLKEEDGKIRFGTIKGVYIYDPEKDKSNKVAPLTHIVNLRLFFENFDFKEFSDSASFSSSLPAYLKLPYNKNHLTFDFIGLSYMIPQKVRYRYMLEGFDKEWLNPVKENFATYSNIPPGKYTFKVKSCNNDGIWSETPATLSFIISPPFWQTWWFRVSVMGILIFGIYIFFKWRLNRLKLQKIYLQQQVDVKTKELREEKEVVLQQNSIIEKKNHNITSSIRYAKRIQESILPLKEKLNELIPESFIFFKPKDIVSGDFYWFTQQNGTILVAAVDCTGHGVPGAFMSLIGNNILNDIVKNLKISDPAQILQKLHEEVVLTLKKGEHESDTVDGMDITLCSIDTATNSLKFSSTGRPLLVVRDNEIKKYKLGKQPLGLVTKKEVVFEKENIQLQPGDTFYIYTDGFCDQFGGQEDEKYLDSNFEKLLLKIQDQKMNVQAKTLENEIENWLGEQPQIDDILVIGIRYT